jgi:hypothetical protein
MAEEKLKWKDFVQEAEYWFQKFQEEEHEEEVYLKNLARHYAVSTTKNYSLARSIVLDIHNTEEYYINAIIGLMCTFGGKYFNLELNGEELIEEIGNIDYMKKISVIEKMNVFSKATLKIMKQINNLRRAFAHGRKEDHPDYKYKGNPIFKKETMSILIGDHKKVTDEEVKFMSRYKKDS